MPLALLDQGDIKPGREFRQDILMAAICIELGATPFNLPGKQQPF